MTNWINEIICPYCKHKYVDVGILDKLSFGYLYRFECNKCGERESWLREKDLYTTYEEELRDANE